MKLYNTLTKTKEEFIPINSDIVTMYTCGPTVYHYAHIGNLRTYIFEDVLEKTLEYLGYKVKRCMNITDVGHLESDADSGEDKMLKGARREGRTVWEVAEFYTEEFFKDCGKLNIKKPEIVKKATDYIDKYIEFIKALEEKGYTYLAGGNVYFDVSKAENYMGLSHKNMDDLLVGARESVTEDKNKKNPLDFVLWFTKSKFENQAMKWDSPWGTGYPGWHIECSTIASMELGDEIDIHCGGVDNIFPHHTNEIAQSEAYSGKKWVNYWCHGEHLNDKTGKMSKSKGEFLTVNLLEEKGYNPLSYRYLCLGSHYRNQLVFSYETLDLAENTYKKLRHRVLELKKEAGTEIRKDKVRFHIERFKSFLSDDLNTSNALTEVYDVLKSEDLEPGEKLYLVSQFDTVLSLGLLIESSIRERVLEGGIKVSFEKEDLTDEEIDSLTEALESRILAKAAKDYAKADSIREEIERIYSVNLKDTRDKIIIGGN